MIGRLTGVAVEKDPDGTCVLDVMGVGYEVFVPTRALESMGAPPDETTLYIHTHVRAESLTLYGFLLPVDRRAFRALLGVSKVGPKVAMALLSELSPAQMLEAVARGDKRAFGAVSGVGKRLAERLVLELRDKLPTGDQPAMNRESAVVALPNGDVAANVSGALVQLGFSRPEAEGAVAKVAQAGEQRPVEEILRLALATLG